MICHSHWSTRWSSCSRSSRSASRPFQHTGVAPADLDALVGVGEQLSTRLLQAWLASRGVEALWLDVREVLITNDRHGRACPQPAEIQRRIDDHLVNELRPGRVVITQGYLGTTAEGQPTTLGRGGSDLTAALLGAALGAEEVQIWTDVEGVHTCDPRVVPEALPLPRARLRRGRGTGGVWRKGAAPGHDLARRCCRRAGHGAPYPPARGGALRRSAASRSRAVA